MRLVLDNVSKVYNRQRIFHKLSYTLEQGDSYAILGGNGSGKSTLIKILSFASSPTHGAIQYSYNNIGLKKEDIPFRISIAAPYLELIEELTAREFLDFYQKLKPFKAGINTEKILDIAYLSESSQKEIRNFSSGMKQRLKLSLAFLSNVDLILLDEPTSNLDPKGINWYQSLIENHRDRRTTVVGSNFDQNEIHFCDHQLELKDFK